MCACVSECGEREMNTYTYKYTGTYSMPTMQPMRIMVAHAMMPILDNKPLLCSCLYTVTPATALTVPVTAIAALVVLSVLRICTMIMAAAEYAVFAALLIRTVEGRICMYI